MSFRTMLLRRSLALGVVAGRLLLAWAAVPHCHDAAAAVGPEKVAGRAAHRHWAWSGHSHDAAGHGHGVPASGDPDDRRGDPTPPAPPDHDEHAFSVADVFQAATEGRDPRAVPPAVSITMPPQAWPGLAARARPPWHVVRSPGGARAQRDLLPHVLRI